MRKKIVYIGIVLLVAAVAVLLLSGSVANIRGLLTEQNVTVAGSMFSSVPITIQNGSIVLLIGSFRSPINFYVFNSTGFSRWSSPLANSTETGYQRALGLRGDGLFFAYNNITSVVVPYQTGAGNVTPSYYVNTSKGMPGGTYYAVMDNGAGSRSASINVNATLLYNAGSASSKKLYNFVFEEAVMGILFFVLLVAGAIVLIFGFVKKDKNKDAGMQTPATAQPKQKDMTDQQIDELYKKSIPITASSKTKL